MIGRDAVPRGSIRQLTFEPLGLVSAGGRDVGRIETDQKSVRSNPSREESLWIFIRAAAVLRKITEVKRRAADRISKLKEAARGFVVADCEDHGNAKAAGGDHCFFPIVEP